jgi:excisionase family DNA binding protein
MSDLIGTNQAAEILKCSPQWVMKLLRTGALKGQRVGGKWIICRSDVEKYKLSKGNTRP